MGHTNSTTNYGLPQFLTTDKPAWLTDINGAMSDIDTGLHTAQSDATTAGNNATQALSDASAAATAASAADAKGAGACASIEAAFDSTTVYAIGAKVMYNSLLYRCTVAVITPGPWTGSANWERITVDSLIAEDAGSLPLGNDFTDPASTASAIKALQNKQLVSLGATSAVTIADTRVDIGSSATVSLDAGNYIIEVALPVTINNASAFFYFNVDVDGTSTNLTTITGPQGNITLYGIAKVAVATSGSHTVKVTGRTSTASKTVTVPTSYNLNMLITVTE